MNAPVAIGVEISVDRDHTSVAVAGRGPDGVQVLLECYLDGTDSALAIAELIQRWSPRNVVATLLDPRSPAGTLLEPLKALKVDVLEASTHIVSAAHGTFLDELRAGRLVIETHPALDAAAKYARSRQLAGAEALNRRTAVDTSPIVAAELATWGALHVPPQRAPRIYVYQAEEKEGNHVKTTG